MQKNPPARIELLQPTADTDQFSVLYERETKRGSVKTLADKHKHKCRYTHRNAPGADGVIILTSPFR